MIGTHTQQIEVCRWPRVLIVHLKRWYYDTSTCTYDKIDDMLHFPAIYQPDSNNTYALRSLVVHDGVAKGGHYFSYTRDERHGWLLYNDAEEPKRVTEQTVLQQCPYMLFYEKL